MGGLGEKKGIACCVDDVHSFPRRMATRGSWMLHHSPLGSAEKAGGLWVLDFITSLPSRFCFFNHFLSVRIQSVLPPFNDARVRLGLLLMLLSNPLAGWDDHTGF